MTDQEQNKFQVDRRLRLNIAVAIILIIVCPLALWQFYFRYDHKSTGEQPDQSELIPNFCRSYNKPVFHAAEVFAPEIERYLGSENITPVDIDHTVAIDRQTNMYPRLSVVEHSIRDSMNNKEQPMVTAWFREVTYVKPVMQYRLREINIQFTFDEQGKIISLDTLGTHGTVYTREMPK